MDISGALASSRIAVFVTEETIPSPSVDIPIDNNKHEELVSSILEDLDFVQNSLDAIAIQAEEEEDNEEPIVKRDVKEREDFEPEPIEEEIKVERKKKKKKGVKKRTVAIIEDNIPQEYVLVCESVLIYSLGRKI